MVGLSENVTNEMKQQFDGMLTLYAMRCDNMTRNIRLVKHALDSKENEKHQQKLDEQNKIEKCLYDLQLGVRIMKQTFNHEMMSNLKHSIKTYQDEYQQFQGTISKAFTLTTANIPKH